MRVDEKERVLFYAVPHTRFLFRGVGFEGGEAFFPSTALKEAFMTHVCMVRVRICLVTFLFQQNSVLPGGGVVKAVGGWCDGQIFLKRNQTLSTDIFPITRTHTNNNAEEREREREQRVVPKRA